MSKFVIIPDSSSDLTKELRDRFDIPEYIPGSVTFPDGHTIKSDLDWNVISPKEFYESMSDKKHLYKTSVPNIADAIAIFEKYLSNGFDVLSVSLSSGLSGTYSVCKTAAEEVLKKYPERKIICVDSLRYSTSLSLLICLGNEEKKKGKTIEEVAAWMNENKNCIHQMGPMDDLFFLARTGRISNFKAFMGKMVGVNPLGEFNKKGLSSVIGKIKGTKNALEATVEYVKGTIINGENQIIFIAHSNRQEKADTLKAMIQKEINPKEIIISQVGMSCGSSIGPGLCAVFYYGKPLTDDLVDEKELMTQIISKKK